MGHEMTTSGYMASTATPTITVIGAEPWQSSRAS